MSFQKRAVETCLRSMGSGRVSSREVRDVIKYENVDVSPFEEYLNSPELMVRRLAVKIVSVRGDINAVIDAAMTETDRSILIDIFSCLGARSDCPSLEKLCMFLESEDGLIRESAIKMFCRVGQESLLFPLVFDEDDNVVERAKSHITQEEERIGR